MTSQVLESNSLSNVGSPCATASVAPTDITTSANSAKKLPYQEDHQVELLHLQAEIDALLQHLQTLKQQRVAVGAGSHR